MLRPIQVSRRREGADERHGDSRGRCREHPAAVPGERPGGITCGAAATIGVGHLRVGAGVRQPPVCGFVRALVDAGGRGGPRAWRRDAVASRDAVRALESAGRALEGDGAPAEDDPEELHPRARPGCGRPQLALQEGDEAGEGLRIHVGVSVAVLVLGAIA